MASDALPTMSVSLLASLRAYTYFLFSQRKSVLLSLLLVFLACFVAGFVTEVVIYSFNGVMLNATTNGFPVINRFDDWSRSFTVGVLGGVAGVLIVSAIVQRR